MEKLLSTGKVKAIGVANHSVKFLTDLLREATITPAVNQIENHPALPQQDIVDFCKEKGIHITAYSPLGSSGSPLVKAEPVLHLSEKHGVAPANILLSYHIARGSSVLAKSSNLDRISANKHIVDLDASDMKVLNDYSDELARTGKLKRYVDRDYGIDLGFPKI
ncbi:H/ACA snoRNP pseudouridylase subunit [Sporothrix eucalyptigena]